MVEFNESEATAAMATESFEMGGSTGVDAATDTYEGGSVTTDFIRTEAAPAEVPKTMKHRGSVTSIVAITSKEKLSRGIEINVQSDSNGRSYKTTIWPPKEWTSNVFITNDELAKIPGPEGLTEKGNPKQTPLQRFGRTIKSTDGTAELQRLLAAGVKAERALNGNYTDFDTLVENLNNGLAGVPVVFTTGADGDPDPQYGFRIKVKNIYPFDAKFDKIRADDASGLDQK